MSSYVRFPLLAAAATVWALAVLLASANGHASANEADQSLAQAPQSKITFRFVRDGEPVEVTVSTVVSRLYADGVECPAPHPGSVVTPGERVELWPRTDPGVPLECSKGPPTTLGFEFVFFAGSGNFIPTPIVEFAWAGGDMTVDLEVPPGLDLAATPTPTPYPQWAISIQFVRDGEPVSVAVIADRPRIYVNGVDCTQGPVTTINPGRTTGGVSFWPPLPGEVDPACLQGPPTPIEFEFLQPDGVIVVAVEWLGTETSVQFEVPASVEVFPAPDGFPVTGGAPHQDSAHWPVLLGLGLLGLMGFLGGAWLSRQVLVEG